MRLLLILSNYIFYWWIYLVLSRSFSKISLLPHNGPRTTKKWPFCTISLLPYHFSITLQLAENILEMTISYDISIALQRAENFVVMTHSSMSL